MKSMLLVGGLAILAWSCPAEAQSWQQIEARYSAKYQACVDTGAAADGDEVALAACSEAEVAIQEGAMAAALAKAQGGLSQDQADALATGQRKWLDGRKSKCDEEAKALVGADTQRLARADCQLDETIRRVIWLEAYKP